jgi:hypothetical protein
MVRTRKKIRSEEAAEDLGTARLVARARREITAGIPLLPKNVVDRLAKQKKPMPKLRAVKR